MVLSEEVAAVGADLLGQPGPVGVLGVGLDIPRRQGDATPLVIVIDIELT